MKVVIYGHKLHSHTSSYVHYGYYKAFKELGHEVLWIDDKDDISNINFNDSLFLTEGQVDGNIPINRSSKYVLHNCNGEKYASAKKVLNLQIFHGSISTDGILPQQHRTFTTKAPLTKVNDYTFYTKKTLYQPWATDLLPREINLDDARNEMDKKECVWIGTYGGGDSAYQNHSTLDPFFHECRMNKIPVRVIDPWWKPVSPEENKQIINESFLAPSIQGVWQIGYGYPLQCRVLKNISYGHMAITNNEFTNKLFDNKLVCDRNTKTLFYKALEKKQDPNLISEIKDLMNEVKTKHTFINRANQILELI